MVCEFVEHLERAVDGVIVELKKKNLGVKRARSSIPGLFLRKEKGRLLTARAPYRK